MAKVLDAKFDNKNNANFKPGSVTCASAAAAEK